MKPFVTTYKSFINGSLKESGGVILYHSATDNIYCLSVHLKTIQKWKSNSILTNVYISQLQQLFTAQFPHEIHHLKTTDSCVFCIILGPFLAVYLHFVHSQNHLCFYNIDK